ncbi:MAG: alanyl-tRNA synthetase [Chitinophagales bacterium]
MEKSKFRKWLKRLGWAGVLFFTIKGILWLVAGAAIYEWLRSIFN